ncbi:MAG: hypothetical protein AVDCRST_MAG54-1497, partial [uncultured Actinomycetospora sp.]
EHGVRRGLLPLQRAGRRPAGPAVVHAARAPLHRGRPVPRLRLRHRAPGAPALRARAGVGLRDLRVLGGDRPHPRPGLHDHHRRRGARRRVVRRAHRDPRARAPRRRHRGGDPRDVAAGAASRRARPGRHARPRGPRAPPRRRALDGLRRPHAHQPQAARAVAGVPHRAGLRRRARGHRRALGRALRPPAQAPRRRAPRRARLRAVPVRAPRAARGQRRIVGVRAAPGL